MTQPALNGSRKQKSSPTSPYHVCHPSFEDPQAEQTYGPATASGDDFTTTHMPDEVTRDFTKRMHYAAWRATKATSTVEQHLWLSHHRHFRDSVILGNRKLTYRAVRRWMPPSSYADDMVGDCQVVLIQAVSAYNPWLGIRFSTYAFTCLMRALSRLSQRHATDRLAKSLPLAALPEGEPRDLSTEELPSTHLARIDEFLREGHDLLSTREKKVLQRRFSLDDQTRSGTLEQVGRELGLSKERVRQVQASALGKLRLALLEGTPLLTSSR